MFAASVCVTGMLEAVDSDMQHMVLSSMHTALGTVPHASIRLSDVCRARGPRVMHSNFVMIEPIGDFCRIGRRWRRRGRGRERARVSER